jgi:hypothetical protein
MRPHLIRLSLMCVSVMALAGCDEPAATLSGAVVKGITANAVISAYDADDNLLDSALSDAQGDYTLDLPPGFTGAVRLTAVVSSDPGTVTVSRCDALSGCGVFSGASAHDLDADLSVDFGEWFPTPADFALSAVTVAEAGVLQAVNLSPLSTFAANWAGDFPQGLDARSAVGANERAAALFGLEAAHLVAPAGDLTDPLWTSLASAEQIKAALAYATFAEAGARFGATPQFIINAAANAFASNEGRILQADVGPSVNLDLLLSITRDLAAGIAMPEPVRTQILADIDAQRADLVVGELTGYRQATVDELLDKLGPMGDQLQQLRLLTGLDDVEGFLLDQEPYFSWLWSEDNLKIAPLGVEVVLYSLISSLALDTLEGTTTPITVLSDNCGFTLVLNPVAKTLRWHGIRFGQTVDLTVSLTAFQAGLSANQFDFGIVGTLTNPQGDGEIDGTLSVDLEDTDLQPMFQALFAGNNEGLKQALFDLAYSLKATVSLEGNVEMVRSGDFNPPQILGGDVALVGMVDLSAADGETIATLNVATAHLTLPNGSHFFGIEGTPVLTVNVANDAVVVINGAGNVLGIPTAYAHAEGTLVNARSLFEHVRSILSGALVAESVDLPTLIMDFFAFDFSELSATGEGVITIPDLGHEYRASLDDLTVTVYQPHSTDVAMTATVDPQNLAIHYMLGDEPWEQKLLLEPQLRTTLMGPDGQFAELTQQDVLDFLSPVLDVLLDTELWEGIGQVDASDCGGGGDDGGGPTAPAIGLLQNGQAISHVIAGAAALHVNFTGVLPKDITSYFARWYIDGVHVPALDGLQAGELPTHLLTVGSHTIRVEFTDTTALTPTIVRLSQALSVRPAPVVITPDISILDGVAISIKRDGEEVRRAPEGANNIEVALTGYNPPVGSNFLLRWYLDGVHHPAYDNQVYASAMVNPLTRGRHSLRLEITNLDAPTQTTARMAEMVVVTPGEPAGGAGVVMLSLLGLLLARRRRV